MRVARQRLSMSQAKAISKRALCVNHDALTSPAQALPQNASHTAHRARCGRGCGGSAVRLLLPGFCGSAVRLRLRKRRQTAGAPPSCPPAAARGNLALQRAQVTWLVGNGGPGPAGRGAGVATRASSNAPHKRMCSTYCVRTLARLRAMSLPGQLERSPQSKRTTGCAHLVSGSAANGCNEACKLRPSFSSTIDARGPVAARAPGNPAGHGLASTAAQRGWGLYRRSC